jgi:hypothetical protein
VLNKSALPSGADHSISGLGISSEGSDVNKTIIVFLFAYVPCCSMDPLEKISKVKNRCKQYTNY